MRARVDKIIAAVVVAVHIFAVPAPGRATEPGKTSTARNVIIFIADGLRHDSVNSTDAPTLLALRSRGVHFANSHSLFPTLTTANASAIATGHYLGDTGDFSNTEYVGFPIFNHGNFGKTAGTPLPFLESDPILSDVDDHFPNGNFLNEESLLALAREHGFNTAAIGKLGPVAIQDVGELKPAGGHFAIPRTIILDDSTGGTGGVPLSPEIQSALNAAGLGSVTAERKQPSGTVSTPGTHVANIEQQRWFVDATTKVVLPELARSGRPFVLVFWSRDPDGTQHNQGDSLNKLTPGINGPTSRAAVANADANLKQILDYVEGNPALRAATDLFVTSDHGFATISKHEIDARRHASSSYSSTFTYVGANGQPEVIPGWLPPGFVALDLAHALSLPLFDPDSQVQIEGIAHYQPVDPSKPPSAQSRQRPVGGNGLIGGTGVVQDHTDAKVGVATNGGSDLIYIFDGDRVVARRIVDFLARQDYVGAIFADSALGPLPGTLPLAAARLEGSAQMPRPAIAVAFKTFLLEPGNLLSAVQIADTPLQEGQGMHGSLGRDNTFNNMAAIGPDFRQGFTDRLPVGNADIAPTAAHILGLQLPDTGQLQGRVLSEALSGAADGRAPQVQTLVSSGSATGRATVLHYQEIEGRRYLDDACFVELARAARQSCR